MAVTENHTLKWHIRMFGALEVTSPDSNVTCFRGTKAGALLAHLALHLDQPTSRETLAELFWPESDSTSKRTRLRQELAALRALFCAEGQEGGSPLEAGQRTITLRSDYVDTDVRQFLNDLQQAKATEDSALKEHLLAQAVTRCQGDLLPEYPASFVPDRALYAQRYEAALRELASLLKARGAYQEAEARLNQLLLREPLLEEAHVDLIHLYAEMGRPTLLRRQYAELEKNLLRELNELPADSTKQVVAKLLSSTAALESEAVSPGSDVEAEREPPVLPAAARLEEASSDRHADSRVLFSRLPGHRALLFLSSFLFAVIALGITALRAHRSSAHNPMPVASLPLEYGKEKALYMYAPQAGEKDNSEARAVIQDKEGNVYAAGLIEAEKEDEDILIVKLNRDLVPQWTSRYSSPEHDCDRANSLVLGKDGGLYVAGETYVPAGHGAEEGWHAVLLKYNAQTGHKEWERRSPEPVKNPDQRIYVKANPLGGVYVGCSGLEGSAQKLLLMRYDSAGSLLWHRNFPEKSNKAANLNDLAVDAEGNVYACGSAARENTPYGINNDWIVLGRSPAGSLLWQRYVDGPTHGGDDGLKMQLCGSRLLVAGHLDSGDPARGGRGTCLAMANFETEDGTFNWLAYDPETGPSALCSACWWDYAATKSCLITGRATLPNGNDTALLDKYDEYSHILWRSRLPAPPGYRSATAGLVFALPTGEIVVAERISPHNSFFTTNADCEICLTKLSPDGIPESRWAFKKAPGLNYLQALALDANGQPTYAGQAAVAGNRHRFLIVRYQFPLVDAPAR